MAANSCTPLPPAFRPDRGNPLQAQQERVIRQA